MSIKNDSSIACVGYARLPDGITAKEVYGVFGIGLLIDPSTGEIIDAVSTLVTDKGNEFIAAMLIGHNILHDGLDEPIAMIERRYFGAGKKSIIAAIKDAYEKFEEYKLKYHDAGPGAGSSMARLSDVRMKKR
ncbi:MAG: DUF3870 domain-containing protein [Clostridia bacterium]